MAGAIMKGIGTTLKDNALNFLGITEKAYITIHDKRSKGKGLSSPPGMEGSVGNIVSKLKNMEIIPAELSPMGADKRYELQFNPESIQIYSHTKPMTMQSLQDSEGAEGVRQSVQQASTMFEVDLWFDAVNISDAFMSGAPIANLPNAAISKIKTGMALAKGDVAFSVRDQIMGFIGAVMDSRTRLMTFSWAKFSFRGTINEMRSTYVMFNPRGEPIRGKVKLRLKKMNDSVPEIKAANKDFDAAFGKAGVANTLDAGSVLGSVKNIIQI